MTFERRFAVIVSFYDARSSNDLLELVKSLDRFNCLKFLVINSDRVSREMAITAESMFQGWSVFVRPNHGMNIAAWSSMIPYLEQAEAALFLQDECQIISDDFLEAYMHELSKPNVGMTGESLNPKWNRRWEDVAQSALNYPVADISSGETMTRVEFYKRCLDRWGVDHGTNASHLRALTWGFSCKVLFELKTFFQGSSKEECIAAEIAVCKQVEQLGYRVTQVHERPFNYIQHREWRPDGTSKRSAG